MERCARALARSVGYQGAATVEYLYAVEEKRYYFLELNPRLQVEHPVTEGITNVNIPSVQLLIGMGVPLWRIPQIRAMFVGIDARMDTEQFDMELTPQRLPESHVVAVSVTAGVGWGGGRGVCCLTSSCCCSTFNPRCTTKAHHMLPPHHPQPPPHPPGPHHL